jgi:uncharacterized membrane protein
MEIVIDLLFWIHLSSLAAGGAAVFGIPAVGSRMGSATPELRPKLFAIMEQLSKVGRAALGLLIITGPLILWLRFNWVPPSYWFWIKMALVVLLLIGVIYAGINGKRAEHGDADAARRAPMLGITNGVIFLLIVLSAVFAFN